MNRDIKDNKLETYISIIKSNEQSSEKLSAYKKANKRITILQEEYMELSDMLKKPKKNKKDNLNKYDIDEILQELSDIDSLMDDDTVSMRELINNYVQYKNLLGKLESETTNIQNEIIRVDESRNKISIQKLNIEDIFMS